MGKMRRLVLIPVLALASLSISAQNLWEAAKAGDLANVKRFVEKVKVPVDRTDPAGWTALQYSIQEGQLDVAAYLLERKAQPALSAKTTWKDASVMADSVGLAVLANDVEALRLLLAKGGNLEGSLLISPPSGAVKILDTPYLAFAAGYPACYGLGAELIKAGAKPKRRVLADGSAKNLSVPAYSYDALLTAIHSSNAPMVRLLLQNGADSNVADAMGRTALLEAASVGNSATIRYLIDAGVSLPNDPSALWTALFQKKDESSIDMLLKAGLAQTGSIGPDKLGPYEFALKSAFTASQGDARSFGLIAADFFSFGNASKKPKIRSDIAKLPNAVRNPIRYAILAGDTDMVMNTIMDGGVPGTDDLMMAIELGDLGLVRYLGEAEFLKPLDYRTAYLFASWVSADMLALIEEMAPINWPEREDPLSFFAFQPATTQAQAASLDPELFRSAAVRQSVLRDRPRDALHTRALALGGYSAEELLADWDMSIADLDPGLRVIDHRGDTFLVMATQTGVYAEMRILELPEGGSRKVLKPFFTVESSSWPRYLGQSGRLFFNDRQGFIVIRDPDGSLRRSTIQASVALPLGEDIIAIGGPSVGVVRLTIGAQGISVDAIDQAAADSGWYPGSNTVIEARAAIRFGSNIGVYNGGNSVVILDTATLRFVREVPFDSELQDWATCGEDLLILPQRPLALLISIQHAFSPVPLQLDEDCYPSSLTVWGDSAAIGTNKGVLALSLDGRIERNRPFMAFSSIPSQVAEDGYFLADGRVLLSYRSGGIRIAIPRGRFEVRDGIDNAKSIAAAVAAGDWDGLFHLSGRAELLGVLVEGKSLVYQAAKAGNAKALEKLLALASKDEDRNRLVEKAYPGALASSTKEAFLLTAAQPLLASYIEKRGADALSDCAAQGSPAVFAHLLSRQAAKGWSIDYYALARTATQNAANRDAILALLGSKAGGEIRALASYPVDSFITDTGEYALSFASGSSSGETGWGLVLKEISYGAGASRSFFFSQAGSRLLSQNGYQYARTKEGRFVFDLEANGRKVVGNEYVLNFSKLLSLDGATFLPGESTRYDVGGGSSIAAVQNQGLWSVTVGGQEWSGFDTVNWDWNWKAGGFIGHQRNEAAARWAYYRKGQEAIAFSAVSPSRIIDNAEGRWGVFDSPASERYRLIVDGRVVDLAGSPTALFFGPSGSWACVYAQKNKAFILYSDGSSEGPFDRIYDLALTDKGKAAYRLIGLEVGLAFSLGQSPIVGPFSWVTRVPDLSGGASIIATEKNGVRVYSGSGKLLSSFPSSSSVYASARSDGSLIVNNSGMRSRYLPWDGTSLPLDEDRSGFDVGADIFGYNPTEYGFFFNKKPGVDESEILFVPNALSLNVLRDAEGKATWTWISLSESDGRATFLSFKIPANSGAFMRMPK